LLVREDEKKNASKLTLKNGGAAGDTTKQPAAQLPPH